MGAWEWWSLAGVVASMFAFAVRLSLVDAAVTLGLCMVAGYVWEEVFDDAG